jgi:hypothetical protein
MDQKPQETKNRGDNSAIQPSGPSSLLCGLGGSAVQRVFDNSKGVGVNNRASELGEGD